MYVTELGKTINRTRTIWILDKFIFVSLLRNCFTEKNKRSNPGLQTKTSMKFCEPRAMHDPKSHQTQIIAIAIKPKSSLHAVLSGTLTQHFLQYPKAGQVYTARFISSICHVSGRVANTKPLIHFQIFSAMRSTLSYPRSRRHTFQEIGAIWGLLFVDVLFIWNSDSWLETALQVKGWKRLTVGAMWWLPCMASLWAPRAMRAVHGEVGKNIAVFQRHPPTEILSGIGSCFLTDWHSLWHWVCTKKMFEYIVWC